MLQIYAELTENMMLMKKIFFFLLAGLSMILTSCNDADIASGSYSYKLSGKVTLRNSESRTDVNLADEIGQMDIVKLSSDSVLIIMNQLNGSVIKATGYVDNQTITLEPYQRSLYFSHSLKDTIDLSLLEDLFNIEDNSIILEQASTFDFTVNGQGTIYNDLVVFSLTYDGKTREGNVYASGKDINLIAKRN